MSKHNDPSKSSFSLLDELDECRDNIIFFADEAGAWQVGVNWEKSAAGLVSPRWLRLSNPKPMAQSVVKVVDTHVDYARDISPKKQPLKWLTHPSVKCSKPLFEYPVFE